MDKKKSWCETWQTELQCLRTAIHMEKIVPWCCGTGGTGGLGRELLFEMPLDVDTYTGTCLFLRAFGGRGNWLMVLFPAMRNASSIRYGIMSI